MERVLKKTNVFVDDSCHIIWISKEILERNNFDFDYRHFLDLLGHTGGSTTRNQVFYHRFYIFYTYFYAADISDNELIDLLSKNLNKRFLVIKVQNKGYVIWKEC